MEAIDRAMKSNNEDAPTYIQICLQSAAPPTHFQKLLPPFLDHVLMPQDEDAPTYIPYLPKAILLQGEPRILQVPLLSQSQPILNHGNIQQTLAPILPLEKPELFNSKEFTVPQSHFELNMISSRSATCTEPNTIPSSTAVVDTPNTTPTHPSILTNQPSIDESQENSEIPSYYDFLQVIENSLFIRTHDKRFMHAPREMYEHFKKTRDNTYIRLLEASVKIFNQDRQQYTSWIRAIKMDHEAERLYPRFVEIVRYSRFRAYHQKYQRKTPTTAQQPFSPIINGPSYASVLKLCSVFLIQTRDKRYKDEAKKIYNHITSTQDQTYLRLLEAQTKIRTTLRHDFSKWLNELQKDYDNGRLYVRFIELCRLARQETSHQSELNFADHGALVTEQLPQ